MSDSKKVRWACPTDRHKGELGSSRPPKDSLLRYCLSCSVESGRLVERVAPALERKRATAAQTSAAKVKARRVREAKARARKKAAETERYTVEGVDLRDEMKRLCKLRAFGGKTGRLFKRPPELQISRRSSTPYSRYGFAEPYANRIVLATWPGQDIADARETLVHELTHIVVGQSRESSSWHGPAFHQLLTAAFKEAYKVLPVGVRDNSYHGRYAAALRRRDTPK